MSTSNLDLEINRADLSASRLVERPLPDLRPGQVRFAIDRFAVTANTVTYAVTGDVLGYWDFFPCEEPGWGRVPAMGWAHVVASSHPDVAVGGRYYGWFPMSRYVDMTVTPTADGLRDDGPHRAAHAPVYRAYVATDRDPFYQPGPDAEDRHALLRGLFITGFLAEDYFADNDWFGAGRVLVISASSKTALGFAHCAASRGGVEVIGVTSPGNAAFTSGLGCYDRVITYDDIETLPADAPIVSIDMSGNGDVLERVHRHFGAQLAHSMAIGRSHHDAPPRSEGLPGPRPAFFFAPTQVKKRLKDWGPRAYQERIATALRQFVDESQSWLEVTRVNGPDAAESTWRAVHSGRVPPNVGYVVSV
jgi:Protein of unknown function (DUF2855)